MTAPPARIAAAEALASTRLIVPGIRCAACIASIEAGMAATPGIAHARVHFGARTLTVQHLPELDGPALVAALARLGFDGQLADAAPPPDDDMKPLLRALGVAGFGAMNVMLLSVSIWSGAQGATRDLFHWLSALIALPVVAYAGRPFFASAWGALRRGRTNMDVPIAIGILMTTGLSLHETIAGGAHAYFDGVTMLILFLLGGRALDAAMRARARDGVGALLSRMAREATRIAPDGSTARIDARAIRVGDRLLVAAGEVVAADGTVGAGSGTLDLSLLTGESLPVPVGEGDAVPAGATSMGAVFHLVVDRPPDQSTVADVARAMEDAGQARAAHVRIADRAARYYAPFVHALALAALAYWLWHGAGWHQAISIAVAVLIITCPCALGLAVPVAQVVAAGALMRAGILLKDGSALERLAGVTGAVFDKTGTLTLGRPVPQTLAHLGKAERAVALALAQASRHPLSRGLADALLAKGVRPAAVADIAETPGSGIAGHWRGMAVAFGPATGATGPGCTLRIGAASHAIGFTDPLRADAADTVARLRRMGIDGAILSGDRAAPVAEVALHLGLPVALAEASPVQKLDWLQDRSAAGQRLLMVGDGVNDAAALAAAHASLAPASGSDVGRQAADALFVGDGLMPVAIAVRTAQRTLAVVKQNFALAIGYNVIAVPLAFMGLVTPLVAAVAMSLSSIIVVANSLRLAGAAR